MKSEGLRTPPFRRAEIALDAKRGARYARSWIAMVRAAFAEDGGRCNGTFRRA